MRFTVSNRATALASEAIDVLNISYWFVGNKCSWTHRFQARHNFKETDPFSITWRDSDAGDDTLCYKDIAWAIRPRYYLLQNKMRKLEMRKKTSFNHTKPDLFDLNPCAHLTLRGVITLLFLNVNIVQCQVVIIFGTLCNTQTTAANHASS